MAANRLGPRMSSEFESIHFISLSVSTEYCSINCILNTDTLSYSEYD